MRRTLLALSGYAVIFIATLFCYYAGVTSRITLGGILLLNLTLLVINIGVLALIYSGLNLRSKDPSLTVLQLLIAISWATLMTYFVNDAFRGSITVIYISMFMYGIFRLRFKTFLVLVFLAVTSYIFTMMLLHHHHPGAVNLTTELVRTTILLIALLWVSYISNYVSSLRRQIQQLASRDSLTNVYNRREIYEILKRQKSFSDRSGLPFTLCMLDLDNFKSINDIHGHQAGDRVLKSFARTIKENIRAEDYLGRYGGEEFLVVFVSIDCNDCNPVCVERLLSATRHLSFPGIALDLRITISIGAAAYIPGNGTIDDLIARADEALYRAKSNGKNRAEYIKAGTDRRN